MEPESPSCLNRKTSSTSEDSLPSRQKEIEDKFFALENEINLLYEHVSFGCHTLGRGGIYLSINSRELDWLGYQREEIVGRKSFADFLTRESRKRYLGSFPESVRVGYVKELELELTGKDGVIRPVLLSSVIKQDSQSNFLESRSVLFDLTEQKKAEDEQRIAVIAFESKVGMVVTDAEGIILKVNRSYCDICGYPAEELIGQSTRKLHSGRHNAEFYAAMWTRILDKGFWEGEVWNRRKNGEVFPGQLSITAVKNSQGVTTHYVGAFTDITKRKQTADEMLHLAFYDPLTHLPNRRLLMDRLKFSLASSARTGKLGALLFLDLDNFKILNDTLGHDFGDLLLQQSAQRIESCVRAGDTVARMGGDEFVVMLENLSGEAMEAATQTEVVGTKILTKLGHHYRLVSHEYSCTSSIGAVLYRGTEIELDELLKQADIAMYQAKKAGRNTLRFFDPEMQTGINARAALEADLNAALKERQLQLYYQVQMDSSCHPIGAEALIRWQHPVRGLISPAQFIPLAEETGQILPIGKWVLKQACAQLQIWQHSALTRHLTLSVNVSAKQFHEPDFVQQVKAAVLHNVIDPTLLKLEPTESILLGNIEEAVETMNALKAIGVHFALDDFGTGFSSLQYLRKLPLNQLKIDQSFVKDLVSNASEQVIVRTIIAMALSLNLQVIAEGVETGEQREILQRLGCNHFQGYLFGKPLPIKEFEAGLKIF